MKTKFLALSLASLLLAAGCESQTTSPNDNTSENQNPTTSITPSQDESKQSEVVSSSDQTAEQTSTGGEDISVAPSEELVSDLVPEVFEIPENAYDPEKEVEITFYTTMGDSLQKIFNTYLEDFNAKYPNIKVTLDPVGGYDQVRDQIKMELATGEHPNVAYCYPDHVALYNKAKGVYTLDSFINSDVEITLKDGTKERLGLTQEQIDDYIEGYYNEGKQFGNGYMYTLPFSKSTEVLYYNKTFFDQHNLTVPTTWQEMFIVCQQIKTIDPISTPLGYDSEANWFITLAEQNNYPYTTALGKNKEDHFLFDNEGNREFVEGFKAWYDLGLVTTQKIYGTYTSGLFVEQDPTAQKSYMSIGSSAGATHQRPKAGDDGNYPFEVGIASIPQDNPENPKVISQGPSVCLFKDDDPQKVVASWLLMKYFTTDVAFQAEFSMGSGYVPVLKSVAQNEVYKEFLDKADGGTNVAALSAKVCMEQEEYYFTSPAFLGSSAARDQVGELLVAVFTNAKTVDAAFKEAVAQCVADS